MGATADVGHQVVLAYRDLLTEESRLGEALTPRGIRFGTSVADQWPYLHEYLNLYARGLSPAGILILGGAPDEGSRATGIPFTGIADAERALGLDVNTASRRAPRHSPSGEAFWGAVAEARASAGDAPLESLFGSIHLAHARPFDVPGGAPEVRDASARHTLALLARTRPQAAVCVGAEALATLADALRLPDLHALAEAPESTWATRWPAGSRLTAYPSAEVPIERPFRIRVIPVPSLAGAQRELAERSLVRLLAYAL